MEYIWMAFDQVCHRGLLAKQNKYIHNKFIFLSVQSFICKIKRLFSRNWLHWSIVWCLLTCHNNHCTPQNAVPTKTYIFYVLSVFILSLCTSFLTPPSLTQLHVILLIYFFSFVFVSVKHPTSFVCVFCCLIVLFVQCYQRLNRRRKSHWLSNFHILQFFGLRLFLLRVWLIVWCCDINLNSISFKWYKVHLYIVLATMSSYSITILKYIQFKSKFTFC